MKNKILAALALLALWTSPVSAAMIAADNRTAPAVERLAEEFARKGQSVMDVLSSSPERLEAQTQTILPFALLITLDERLAQSMAAQSRAVEIRELPASPLCLWSREEFGARPQRLNDPGVILALADPKKDPLGIPAVQWLKEQGLWEPLRREKRLRLRPTARQAAELAASGGADLVLAPRFLFWNAGGSLMTLPLEGAKTFGLVLSDAGAAARAFMDYLASPQALPAWQAYGFGRR